MRLLFFATLLPLFVGALNYYLYRKAERWLRTLRAGQRALAALRVWFIAINVPFAAMMVLWLTNYGLEDVPERVLRVFFYPFFAWVAMLLTFVIVAAPVEFGLAIRQGFRYIFHRRTSGRMREAASSEPSTEVTAGRRGFLLTAASVVPVGLFAVMTRAVYGSEDIEVSPLLKIPVHGLPRAFDGLTITQLSDLHAGAYIREPELRRAVELANGLRADVTVVTGDILDISLEMLPVAQQALSRLRAPLGVYGILGNHDYYADRRTGNYPGCERIMAGMREAGMRMLRDSRETIGLNGERLVLAGLDWRGNVRGNPNIYVSGPNREALQRIFEGDEGGSVRVLLGHHPHVFYEAGEFHIALTLAGHTHGGGQIVIAEYNGQPIALGSALFRWVSGHYEEAGRHLYVNRGIGFVALPIRIQCPPEISRFQLVRA